MLTKGWDTISIVNRDKINSDLRAISGSMDTHFHEKLLENFGYVEGIFDCFRLIDGAGGKYLRMALPIRSGKLQAVRQTISLDGATAVIEIKLALVPTQKNMLVLKAEYKRRAPGQQQMTDEESGWINPITLLDAEKKTVPWGNIALDGICNYLSEHPKQLELIFAEINFAKSTSPKWVLPKKCTYSYLDSGYLALMAVCNEREISMLPLDIDVSGIPLGTNSFFVMSGGFMLKNLILPGLIPLFQNAKENSYTSNGAMLRNNHELRMSSIKSGAIYYTPVIPPGGNTIRIEREQIIVNYTGTCDMRAGITMNWNGSVTLTTTLENNDTLLFSVKDSNFSHDEDIPIYLSWLIPIVGAIVNAIVAVISDDLIDSIQKRSSSIHAGSIDTVTWCKKQSELKSVHINESLLLEYK